MLEGMARSLGETFSRYVAANRKIGKEFVAQVLSQNDPVKVMELIAGGVPFPFEEKQRLLEADSLEGQFYVMQDILIHETTILQVKEQLQRQVKDKVDKNQKEYILREDLIMILQVYLYLLMMENLLIYL